MIYRQICQNFKTGLCLFSGAKVISISTMPYESPNNRAVDEEKADHYLDKRKGQNYITAVRYAKSMFTSLLLNRASSSQF